MCVCVCVCVCVFFYPISEVSYTSIVYLGKTSPGSARVDLSEVPGTYMPESKRYLHDMPWQP